MKRALVQAHQTSPTLPRPITSRARKGLCPRTILCFWTWDAPSQTCGLNAPRETLYGTFVRYLFSYAKASRARHGP